MKHILLLACLALTLGLTSCNHTSRNASPVLEGFKQWAATPPMGWNSWDCYGPTVTEAEVKANADYMARYLKPYGWEYVVVDIRWFVENDKAGGYNQTDPIYVMDEYGRYQPAVNRFPSAEGGAGFKPLADYVHSLGLKFGIHIMRGISKKAVAEQLPILGADSITADMICSDSLLCQWLRDNYTVDMSKPGAQAYYNSLFNLYASWGVDFVKIDDMSRPYHTAEIEAVRQAIDSCGRPIVLSLSPGETPIANAKHVREHANMWRMVDDVWDVWTDVTHLMDVAENWYRYISPGTWPDCDMIPLGRISIRGERGEPRQTRLTPDEQYSLMTLFTILRSPLMFGGDLPSLDEFTLSLLTNDEVLRMHRESTHPRRLLHTKGRLVISSRNEATDEVYIAMFNISDTDEQTMAVDLNAIGLEGTIHITDLWQSADLGTFSGTFRRTLRPHACGLYLMKRERKR